ncbi:MAG TPA: peptide-methionine (S)-S-oxide reductase MsrA [Accumulibacter sp.]|nr:peptide-methionine (S)-S-oxide reductase MsrA [Accumulibacter sp.]HMW17106.1 peptide-methionine (S)-S-oxide reductase MsrA [Accumulibacter sp.]HMX23774.1 peptide-methionine (S)-S-oxide reductase MsrA [Accumulibacter sp.]HMY05717.1 peptide-methionine (S)-S-oxide reductase MsrA [Accumulibacter sp.]HNC17462.1 peptide-methionine (S)-S-oxide reductase MsrA [Accumulibacter sp.]
MSGDQPGKGHRAALSSFLALFLFLTVSAPLLAADLRMAIFAGGCFWCVEADFEELPGVISAESGYTGGWTVNPSYEQVSAGNSGHTEAVRVLYDARQISYSRLLDHFWRHIDPTVKNRQFCDVGPEYRSVIYWQTTEERLAAERSRDVLLASGRFPRIETEIVPASVFYPAEEYHQDYYRKHPWRYAYFRFACRRDARLQQIWGNR